MSQPLTTSSQVFCLVYAPIADAEPVKQAMFQAGAGRIGEYQGCVWQVAGEGQFIPEIDAQPTIGKPQQNTKVAELCIHCVCPQDQLSEVIKAIKASHPYQTPAYVCLPCLNI